MQQKYCRGRRRVEEAVILLALITLNGSAVIAEVVAIEVAIVPEVLRNEKEELLFHMPVKFASVLVHYTTR